MVTTNFDGVEFDPPIEIYKDVRDEWLEALRSGKYPQTQKRLRDSTGYCCLGVLCDLHSTTSEEEWKALNGPSAGVIEMEIVYEYGHSVGMPSNDVMRWCIPAFLGYADEGESGQFATRLSEINDAGESFEVIAKFIENNTVGI